MKIHTRTVGQIPFRNHALSQRGSQHPDCCRSNWRRAQSGETSDRTHGMGSTTTGVLEWSSPSEHRVPCAPPVEDPGEPLGADAYALRISVCPSPGSRRAESSASSRRGQRTARRQEPVDIMIFACEHRHFARGRRVSSSRVFPGVL